MQPAQRASRSGGLTDQSPSVDIAPRHISNNRFRCDVPSAPRQASGASRDAGPKRQRQIRFFVVGACVFRFGVVRLESVGGGPQSAVHTNVFSGSAVSYR